jgi:hypothetical protein
MAAEESLTLRMRATGARAVKRAVDSVGRSIRDIGRDTRGTRPGIDALGRALTVLSTRAAIGGYELLALGGAAAATLPQIANLAAAMTSLGFLALPIMALVAGAMLAFQDTSGIAGSAASELKQVLDALKTAFRVMVFPGAAAFMRGLSAGLTLLIPVMEQLRLAFTAFGGAIGDALVVAAQGLAGAAPQIATGDQGARRPGRPVARQTIRFHSPGVRHASSALSRRPAAGLQRAFGRRVRREARGKQLRRLVARTWSLRIMLCRGTSTPTGSPWTVTAR